MRLAALAAAVVTLVPVAHAWSCPPWLSCAPPTNGTNLNASFSDIVQHCSDHLNATTRQNVSDGFSTCKVAPDETCPSTCCVVDCPARDQLCVCGPWDTLINPNASAASNSTEDAVTEDALLAVCLEWRPAVWVYACATPIWLVLLAAWWYYNLRDEGAPPASTHSATPCCPLLPSAALCCPLHIVRRIPDAGRALDLHRLLLWVPLIQFCHAFLSTLHYQFCPWETNIQKTVGAGWVVVAILKEPVMLVCLLMVAKGWCITRPSLGFREVMQSSITIMLLCEWAEPQPSPTMRGHPAPAPLCLPGDPCQGAPRHGSSRELTGAHGSSRARRC